MPPVTVLEKVYGPLPPGLLEPALSSLLEGLRVEARVLGKAGRGWVQVEVSGEDEAVALRYLDQRLGLAPVSLPNLKKSSEVRGRVLPAEEGAEGLPVDVGVFSPRICDASIPLGTLASQLAGGRALPLRGLLGLFCLRENLPLSVRVVSIREEAVEAELSKGQLLTLERWVRSNLDRLLVLGAPLTAVERAVGASGHARDVAAVEPLGLLEQSVVCKLGTDAAGLIPRLGPRLPHATLAVFSPRKIQRAIGDSWRKWTGGPGRT